MLWAVFHPFPQFGRTVTCSYSRLLHIKLKQANFYQHNNLAIVFEEINIEGWAGLSVGSRHTVVY